MKRALSLILILAILCSLCMVFAQEDAPAEETPAEEIAEVAADEPSAEEPAEEPAEEAAVETPAEELPAEEPVEETPAEEFPEEPAADGGAEAETPACDGTSASNTSGSFADGLNWTIDTATGTLTIGGTGAIPDYSSDNYDDIPWYYFADSGAITSISIESGVTGIGDYAFYLCSAESVTIPLSVASIGRYAFEKCSGLKTVNYGGSDIDRNNSSIQIADEGNTYLINAEWKYDHYVVHYDANGGDNAPADQIITPDVSLALSTEKPTRTGYVFIGWAKNSGAAAADLKPGDSYTGVYSTTLYAVWRVSSGTSGNVTWVMDPDTGTLTISGEGTMNDYSNSKPAPWTVWSDTIETVTVQDGVTSIGACAFANCAMVKTACIPASLTCISASAFTGCDVLADIRFSGSYTKWQALAYSPGDGVTIYYGMPDSAGSCGTGNNADVNWAVYLASNKLIISGNGDMADMAGSTGAPWSSYGESILTAEIQEGVTGIGANAFSACSRLTGVTMASTVAAIGAGAFTGCGALTQISLPAGLQSIGAGAFMNCTGLTEMTIPSGVTSIGKYAFAGCTGLQAIYADAENTAYASADGVLFSKDMATLVACPNGKAGSYAVPAGVTTIGDYAFEGCASLQRITLPFTLKYVRSCAFYQLAALADVYYGGTEEDWADVTVEENNNSLTACTGLHYTCTLTYDANGGEDAPEPQSCYDDQSLIISQAIPSRTGYSFEGWSESKTADSAGFQPGEAYSGSASAILYAVWKPIVQQGTCGDNAAWELNEGTGVLTISGTGKMDDYYLSTPKWKKYQEFIRSVVVADGITRIGTEAFSGYTALTAVTIPESVNEIGNNAFYGTALQDVYYGAGEAEKNAITVKTDQNAELFAAAWHYAYYMVSYDANGGTGVPEAQKKYNGVTLTLDNTAPVRDGCDFQGWTDSLAADGTVGTVYQPGAEYTIDGAATLYAVWKPADITALTSGTTGTASVKTAGSRVYYSFTPDSGMTYVLYTTDGSNAKASLYTVDGYSRVKQATAISGENGNLRLAYPMAAGQTYILELEYADETAAGDIAFTFGPVYTITFDANGGENAPGSQTKDYGTDLTIPGTAPTRNCCLFLGWDTDSAAQDPKYPAGSIYTENASADLAAVWMHTSGTCGSGTTWELDPDTGVLTISGTGATDDFDSASPAPWNEYSTYVKSVTVEEGVTNIGNSAFAACTGLESLTIRNQDCTISDSAIAAGAQVTVYAPAGSKAWEYVNGNGSATFSCLQHQHAADASPESITVDPTCTEAGKCCYRCSVCGASYEDTLPATGHTPVTDTAVAATCTTTGLTEGSHCSVCGAVITAQEVIQKLPHTPVTDAAVAATCTETGLTEGSHCSVCGTVLAAQTVIPAKGHTKVIDQGKAPTCTETGLTEGSHCAVCGTVLAAQQAIQAAGHTEVTDAAVAATCTKTGLTAGSHCSVCNEVLLARKVIPATGHTVVTDEAVAATCIKTGRTEGSHCSVCGTVIKAQETTPILLTHTPVTDAAVAATCTETGLTEGSHCSVCGTILAAQAVIPAKGHSYTSAVTMAATYGAPGILTYTCSACHDSYTESIPALVITNGWAQDPDGSWYYFKDSTMVKGSWLKSGSTWYYLRNDGKMASDEVLTVGSTKYAFKSSGAMVTGWGRLSGGWYYASSSGALRTGWLKSGSAWYYLGADGRMASDEVLTIGTTKYAFKANGAMVTGWGQLSGGWYYANSSGALRTGWLKSGSAWYYLGTDGRMYNAQWCGNYYLRSGGAMATGWQSINGSWYYFSSSGYMRTGWLKSGSSWYYLGSDGRMYAAGVFETADGSLSEFAANGAWIGYTTK